MSTMTHLHHCGLLCTQALSVKLIDGIITYDVVHEHAWSYVYKRNVDRVIGSGLG